MWDKMQSWKVSRNQIKKFNVDVRSRNESNLSKKVRGMSISNRQKVRQNPIKVIRTIQIDWYWQSGLNHVIISKFIRVSPARGRFIMLTVRIVNELTTNGI